MKFMNLVRFLPVVFATAEGSGAAPSLSFDLEGMMQTSANEIVAYIMAVLGIVVTAILTYKGIVIAVKFGLTWLNKIGKN